MSGEQKVDRRRRVAGRTVFNRCMMGRLASDNDFLFAPPASRPDRLKSGDLNLSLVGFSSSS